MIFPAASSLRARASTCLLFKGCVRGVVRAPRVAWWACSKTNTAQHPIYVCMAGCLHFTSNNKLCGNAHLRLDVADHGLELLAAEDAVLDQEALLEELLQLQGLGVGVVHTCAGPGSVGGPKDTRARSIDRSIETAGVE